jgi:ligand-binding sensor domain-containing protein/two-component sensor histidine kinase
MPGCSVAWTQTEDYSVSTWGTRDGLPEMAVEALAFDPAGGLWVGTLGGPCLFDGSFCKPLQNNNASSIPAKNLTTLLRVRDKSIWAGTEGGGLLHFSHGVVDVFDERNGLADGYIRAIFEDSSGTLWVGTDDGFFRKSGAHFERISFADTHSAQDVHAIAEDSDHRILVGGEALSIIDSRGVIFPYSTTQPVPERVRALLLTHDGHLIVGTVSGAFERNSNGEFKRLPLPRVDVDALYESLDGTVWCGTIADGLWRISAGQVSRTEIGENAVGHSIQAIAMDAGNRLWVGTETGLSRIQMTNVHLIPSSAAAVDQETLGLSLNSSVVLVNSHLYKLDKGVTVQIPSKIKLDVPLLNVLYASDRSVWLGTAGKGVYRVSSEGKISHYSTDSQLKIAADYAKGIVEGEHGDVWVATWNGLNRIGTGKVEVFSSSNGLPNRQVRSLLRDHNGCMWIGTDGGPAIYCSGKFVESPATRSLSGEEIWALAEDTSGVVWLGTRNHGIYAYRDSQMRHFTTSDGLISNFICGLAVDLHGTLWISSPETISSISVDQTLDAQHTNEPVFARSYPLPSTAKDLRFSGGRFPNAMVDARNVVWFATNRGAVYVTPQASVADTGDAAPLPVITSVLADDVFLLGPHKTRIPADSKRLTFSFRAVSLAPESDVLLTYRLVGLDDRWTVSAGAHEVDYRGLAPGKYTFELKAYSRSKPTAFNTSRISFSIPVIWYHSTRFYLGALAMLAFCSVSVYTLQMRNVKGRFRIVLKERARLAREMHDTLIQGCNGVAMLLEAEASSRGPEHSSFLDMARNQLRSTVADAREAVWGLRQTRTEPGFLESFIHSISTQTTSSYGLPVKVYLDKDLPCLPSDAAHGVLMIVREAVANAVNHGRPDLITISAEYRNERLLVKVSDNGVGFDLGTASAHSSDHYGILGMRERAEAIGAKLQLETSQGSGTTVAILMPVVR